MERAKKIAPGYYEYKGYEINKVTPEGYAPHWNISAPGELNPCDGAETKREAMEMVDRWTQK